MRRLLLIVALVATALTFSVLPTSYATAHGPHVSRHRLSASAPRPDEQPVIAQSPDSLEQPSDDLLTGKRLVIVTVTLVAESVARVMMDRAPPAGRARVSVGRAELQVWRV